MINKTTVGSINASNSSLFVKTLCLVIVTLGTVGIASYVIAGNLFALSDFSAFYNAGKMALTGQSAESYDLQSYQHAYMENFKTEKSGYGWFYPPHFLLPLTVLSELPRVFAKVARLVATYVIYLFGMSKLIRRPVEWVFVLFLPAAIVNLYAAQTGFLATGLLALYLGIAEGRKASARASAGLFLAFLTFKPHLWATLPLLVLVRRQYIVLISSIIGIVILVVASIFAFGIGSWTAMFSSVVSGYGEVHDGNTDLLNKMSTVAAIVSALGLAQMKLAIQLFFLTLSIGAIMWMGAKKPNNDILTAFVVVSGFVVAPHNMVYDHTILIIPCLLLMRPENEIPNWAVVLCGIVFFYPYVLVSTDIIDYLPIGAVLTLVFIDLGVLGLLAGVDDPLTRRRGQSGCRYSFQLSVGTSQSFPVTSRFGAQIGIILRAVSSAVGKLSGFSPGMA